MRFYLVYFVVLVKILLLSSQISAQENAINDFINTRNYEKAIEVILLNGTLENLNNSSLEKLGYCYIMTRRYDKAEEVYAKLVDSKNPSIQNLKYYAETLMINLKFDKAKEWLNRCRESSSTDKLIEIKLASCDSLKIWQKLEPNYLIKDFYPINTQFDEMCATFTTTDFVYLTTRETPLSVKEPRNFITASQFIIKGYNSSLMDTSKLEIAEKMVNQLNKTNIANEYWCSSFDYCKQQNLFAFAVKKIQRWTHDISLGNSIIVFDGMEDRPIDSLIVFKWDGMPSNANLSQPCFAKNGTRLYFSSDMYGGCGGMDLYYSDLEMGIWTKPVNLGTTVNSPFDEISPAISGDSLLYFSSNGQPGYGNFDVFFSAIHSNTYDNPINMKAPINSIGDDLYFRPIIGQFGLLTSDRSPNGKGGYDVYFVNNISNVKATNLITLLPDTIKELNIPNFKLPYILFDFNQTIIDENYDEILKNLADTLKLCADIKLNILGHTDNVGSVKYNLVLSELRAKAIADRLISLGVLESKITYKGLGISEDEHVENIKYTVVLNTLNSADYIQWFKEKLAYQIDVFVLPNGNKFSYCVGNFENIKDAEVLLQNMKVGSFSKSHIGAFYFGRYIANYKTSINRRVDLKLSK